MAARTSASVGVAVTITILGVLSLGLFVTTLIFYGNMTRAQTEQRALVADMESLVTGNERNHETVRQVIDAARAERVSAVTYLIRSWRETMQAASGDEAMTVAQLKDRLASYEDGGTALLAMVQTRDDRIGSLTRQLDEAEAARARAQQYADQVASSMADIEGDFQEQATSLAGEVGDHSQQVLGHSQRIEQTARRWQADVDQLTNTFTAERNELEDRLGELRQQNLSLQDKVNRLSGEGAADGIRPLPEEALADGQINTVNVAAREVILSIGRKDKVVLGMTFAVYDDQTSIRPVEGTDLYRPGKADVEVIRVEENYSVARILRQSAGNPIVRGDVVANAVYDPKKVYKVVVFGQFDVNRDGYATDFEREDLEGYIRSWGGIVVDDVAGDTDFIILGQKPTLPPPPGINAQRVDIETYTAIQRTIQRYDELLRIGQDTSIPILNENRLRTLIGDYAD